MNLDVDLNNVLRKGVDVHETRVGGARKTTELRNKTNIALSDRFVGIWAADTAWNSTKSTDNSTKSVDLVVVRGFESKNKKLKNLP